MPCLPGVDEGELYLITAMIHPGSISQPHHAPHGLQCLAGRTEITSTCVDPPRLAEYRFRGILVFMVIGIPWIEWAISRRNGSHQHPRWID